MPALVKSVAEHGSIENLLYDWATTVGAESGGIVQWRVPGTPPVALVADPAAVRAIFEVGRWQKSPLYQDLEPLLGPQSLVLTEKEEWREQREAYNSAFTGNFLRGAYAGFCDATRELLAALDEAAAFNAAKAAYEGAAEGAAEADKAPSDGDSDRGVARVWELAVLATVEIIFRVGFGAPRGLLSRADRDPLKDALYRAFYDLGTHVAWFLDNVPFNRLKNLPFNVRKTARLRGELERELGAVLDVRLAAMRASGVLPAGVEVVDSSSSSWSSSSACPFVGLPGGPAAGVEAGEGEATTAAGLQQASQQQQQQQAESAAATSAAGDGALLLEDDQFSLDELAAAAASPLSPPSSSSASPSGGRPTTSSSPSSSAAASPTDILSMAVATFVAQGAKTIDRSALLSQQATLFGAGHDTTAGLLGWAVYYLSRDDARRARLVAEIDALFAARSSSGGASSSPPRLGGEADVPTWEELASLPYLTAVIKETLRFRPPIGMLARVCPVPAPSSSSGEGGGNGGGAPGDDDFLQQQPSGPDDIERGAVSGYDMRGKICVIAPFVLHRLERYWGSDAAEWVPERWLDDEGAAPPAPGSATRATVPARALSVPQYAYVPFSRGARDCIGSRFATIEAKVILASLFRRFEFEWAGPAGGERVRMALTAHPQNGVPMRVRWRSPDGDAGAAIAVGAGAEAADEAEGAAAAFDKAAARQRGEGG